MMIAANAATRAAAAVLVSAADAGHKETDQEDPKRSHGAHDSRLCSEILEPTDDLWPE